MTFHYNGSLQVVVTDQDFVVSKEKNFHKFGLKIMIIMGESSRGSLSLLSFSKFIYSLFKAIRDDQIAIIGWGEFKSCGSC